MNKDLTVGKPSTVLWRFCLPLFGSVIFQQLYNIADSLVAGKFIGEDALAAVGNSYEITLIFIAFAFGCNIGCSVVVSRLFGAKEYRGMKTAVCTAMLVSLTVCALLMALGFIFCRPLLGRINTPATLMGNSLLYLRIYICGLPFLFFYQLATGIFSALGDSKTPFLFLAASSLSNIAADVVFVTALGMGVDGVAWATFLCQGVSCILAVWLVFRRLSDIPTQGRWPRFSLPILKQLSVIAVPSILQQSFISVGNIVIQGAINRFGPGVIAGYSAAIKLNNLVITSFTTIGNGISNFTAQNIGAGKPGRIREGFRAGHKMVWAISLPLCIAYVLGGERLLYLFLEQPTAKAVQAGREFLRIVSPFYLVVSLKLVADGILRGAGMMKRFMVTTFTALLLRVALALTLSKTALGSTGIWLAWPVGWVVATTLSLVFYRTGHWSQAPRLSGEPAQQDEKGRV